MGLHGGHPAACPQRVCSLEVTRGAPGVGGGPADEPAALAAGSALGALAPSSRQARGVPLIYCYYWGVFLLRPECVRVFTKTELQKSHGVYS